MKLHQSGDKIIVTELMPMSEAPRDGVSIFCILNGSVNFREMYFHKGCWRMPEVNCGFHDCNFEGWIPMPIHQPESKSQDKAALYEKIRKLNPREFAELHERNLRGEGSFDDLVSRLP